MKIQGFRNTCLLLTAFALSFLLFSCGLQDVKSITDDAASGEAGSSDISSTTEIVLSGYRGPDGVSLTWTDSTRSDLTQYSIRRSETVLPLTIFQGEEVYNGFNLTTMDSSVTQTKSYYYSVFRRNGGENWKYYKSLDFYVPTYKEALHELITSLNAYADERSGSNFILVFSGENGILTADSSATGELPTALMSQLDGVLKDSLFYGPTENDAVSDSSADVSFLNRFKPLDKKIMALDYCSTQAKIDHSEETVSANSYIGFQRPESVMTSLPSNPNNFKWTSKSVLSLNSAVNFFYSKSPLSNSFLNDINANSYHDVLIINPFLDNASSLSNLLTAAQVSNLSSKPNYSTSRLVLAHIDLTRLNSAYYYWQASWANSSFIGDKIGSTTEYKVQYWTPSWKAILYGNSDSLIEHLINQGFDGAIIATDQFFTSN